ncbi:E3 SUMO-protein ligase SIZ2 isoform X3 [Physcomitrium patens]|uniref:E3 SUMO-protein ligase SIZ2 isoform X3 n=1 Tax=Physcomitrium patens TaxID=3218 RepID=UPI000D151ABF|nr:E3 SUMO-protein ligase SIZ1-like isoform X3 [Physcomitrium patens]|eukprot:XP_024357536.1 E3 SUMO-protein ligase SIZ1-like isoform X3 [Physcomitrella patens]
MADVATRCRSQLGSFRIRELKDVLSRLGLPKQGKKQILMDKIMGLINPADKQSLTKGSKSSKKVVSREEAIAIIDEQYRKLRHSGTESKHKVAKSGSSSGYPSAGPEDHEVVEETRTRCPCGSNVETGTMIQCDNNKCKIWQHMDCVVIPEKPSDGTQPEIPSSFYCELCRIARGDPFCEAQTHTLMPTKLLSSTAKTEGSNTLQTIEKSFFLSRADRELLQKLNYDLQVWCVLLSDKVSFRMHWPSYADLRVNGISVRVTNRPGQQLLGANGRDEGPGITVCAREGMNRLNMSAYDARPFCLGVRIIRRLTLEQVKDLIPNEKDGEPFEEAMARVRRCINGGGGQGLGGNDDSDSDLEVVAESITVNLRCPMSGSRIKVAGRFKPCLHMGCFDLDTCVELNQRARKWQCPICLKNYSIENLIIDPFFNQITNAQVRTMDEDITEVELKADGSWRPKLEGHAKNGESWRPPPVAVGANIHKATAAPVLFFKHVKTEEGMSSHDNGFSRFKVNPSGDWARNATKHLNDGPSQKVVDAPRLSRSSSATDSNLKIDEDEHSVNHDPSEKNAVSMDDNEEVEYLARPRDAPGGTWQTSGDDPANGADVIVLSDSDDDGGEEEDVVASSAASMYAESDVGNRRMRSREVSHTNGDSSGLALGLESTDVTLASNSVCNPFDPPLSTRVGVGVSDEGTSNNSGFGLQSDRNSFWVSAEKTRNGQYSFYAPRTESVNVLQHPPPVRPTPVQALAGPGFLSVPLVRDDASLASGWKRYSRPYGATGTDGGSVDSDTDASPLQNFLPSQPARAEVQDNLRGPFLPEADDIDNSWFSLSLGGGENLAEPSPARSNLRTSLEQRSPIPQPRVTAHDDTHGRSVILPQTAILFQ